MYKSAELDFDWAWDEDDFAESLPKVLPLEFEEWEFDLAEFPRNFAETKDEEEDLGTFNGALLWFLVLLDVPMGVRMELLWDFLGTMVEKISSLSEDS